MVSLRHVPAYIFFDSGDHRICGFVCPVQAQEQFPVGTVIAIVLDHTLDSRNSRPGQRIVARVAQEVLLEDKRVIRVHPRYSGKSRRWKIVLDRRNSACASTGLSLAKQRLRSAPRCARCLCHGCRRCEADNPAAINTCAISDDSSDRGDAVLRAAGTVENDMGEVVGKPVYGGVLAMVVNRRGSKCEGMPVSKTPQAVWLFSPHACGVYGPTVFSSRMERMRRPARFSSPEKIKEIGS